MNSQPRTARQLFGAGALGLCVLLTLGSAQADLASSAERIRPFVVLIQIYNEADSAVYQGNGFFSDADGEVISNWHVLEGAHRAEVLTADGRRCPVKGILAEDKSADLIILAVDPPAGMADFPRVKTGRLESGVPVAVVGRDLQNKEKVHEGKVRALEEHVELGSVMEISAQLYPGLSGSPIINASGEVVGTAACRRREDGDWHYYATIGARFLALKKGGPVTFEQWPAGRADRSFFEARKLYDRGLDLVFGGSDDKAVPVFEQAVQKNPGLTRAWIELGYCYDKTGRRPAALKAYEKAIDLDKNSAAAQYGLGLVLLKLGRTDEAAQAFGRVTELRPNYREGQYNLGVAFDRGGRLAEAIRAYQAALAVDPDYYLAYEGLGIACFKTGEFDDAIWAFNKAIALKPDYYEAYRGLGLACLKAGRYGEAVTALKTIAGQASFSFEAYKGLGIAYTQQAAYADAVAAFGRALKIKPGDADLEFNLGICYGRLGQHTKEIAAYEKAVTVRPGFGEAYHNMGIAYSQLKNYPKAIGAFTKATQLMPESADAFYGLGSSYCEMEHWKAAQTWLERAVKLEPRHAGARFNLVITYLSLGDTAAAKEQYRILKTLDAKLARELEGQILK